MTDIETRKKYIGIAQKLSTIADASEVDGDELAELLALDELVLLQKQIAKAIERKVIG